MFVKATTDVLGKSTLKVKDIQTPFLGNMVYVFTGGQTAIASHTAAEIGLRGIPATRLEGACASGVL